jgi:acetyl esterase/lipase
MFINRHILSVFILLAFASCSGEKEEEENQPTEQLKLWPEESRGEAEIFVYHPLATNRPSPAVLICPGGGYSWLYMENEGHKIARWFVSQGYVSVVLKYRLPGGIHTIPLSDAGEAMSTIRRNAAAWNIDVHQTGVVGASAGGHLAACLSTLAADGNRPDFAILFYPVITFDYSITHYATREALLGSDMENKNLVERYSIEKQIDGKTPPTLLLVCEDDETVNPQNAIRYHAALQQQHVPVEIHLFPKGGHGWGLDEHFPYHKEVKSIIHDWLTVPKS